MGKGTCGGQGASHILVLKVGCGYVGACSPGSLYTLHTGYKYASMSIYIY